MEPRCEPGGSFLHVIAFWIHVKMHIWKRDVAWLLFLIKHTLNAREDTIAREQNVTYEKAVTPAD